MHYDILVEMHIFSSVLDDESCATAGCGAITAGGVSPASWTVALSIAGSFIDATSSPALNRRHSLSNMLVDMVILYKSRRHVVLVPPEPWHKPQRRWLDDVPSRIELSEADHVNATRFCSLPAAPEAAVNKSLRLMMLTRDVNA